MSSLRAAEACSRDAQHPECTQHPLLFSTAPALTGSLCPHICLVATSNITFTFMPKENDGERGFLYVRIRNVMFPIGLNGDGDSGKQKD